MDSGTQQPSRHIAYTAGLLGNLGNVLIHIVFPSEANEIDQQAKAGNTPRSEIERNCLGFTNQEACAELCRRWKFADELIEAIQQSGGPLSFEQPSAYACTLYLAQYISNKVDSEKTEEAILADFPFAVAEQTGLSKSFISENLAEILAIQSKLEGLVD
jgi:HD-like signal output (HDOD) protein